MPSSPGSQELEEFHAYNRSALPALLELRLRAVLTPEVIILEESIRPLLTDIVRECQSIVAENFRTARAPRTTSLTTLQTSSSEAVNPVSYERSTSGPTASHSPADYFQEPPHVDVEAGASCPRPSVVPKGLTRPQSLLNDSGYGSTQEPCSCECHAKASRAEEQNCENCVGNHFDFSNLSFNDFMNLDDL